MLLLAVLAIAIQSLVIQPHIHGPAPETGIASAASEGGILIADSGKDGSPLESDQTDCPICQSAHQNGHYLKPGAAVFALPLHVNFHTIELAQLAVHYETVSHSWQGRAPPQA